jgi:signal transduction histidine kinase
MDTNITLDNSISGENNMKTPADSAVVVNIDEAGFILDDSQEFMLKAQKDAEQAKAVALQAINQAFQQSEVTVQHAEALARVFDDALQGNFGQIRQGEKDPIALGRLKKLLNNGQNPLNAISDMTKSLFINKSVDAETRKEFYNLVVRHSQQLREMVEELVQQQVEKRTEKAIEEARSDRIASKLVVEQTRCEIDRAREELAQAQSEAETSRSDAEEAINIARAWVEEAKRDVEAERKAAEVKVSHTEQQAMSRTAEEVKKAKDEVAAAKEAARITIKNAEAEVRRSRQEAETARNQAQLDVAQAQEKARQEIEKAEAIKQQSQATIDEALTEAAAAREEAEKVRRKSEQAVNRACEESRKAIEKAEQEKKHIRETVVEAQHQSYQDICEEMKKVNIEAEATRKSASETIKRAQEESRKAKEEAAAANKAAEAALAGAAEETRQAREEAEKARQSLQEVIVRAQEENRLIKEEAEASILLANETMKNARRDIIGMTIGEITRTRQELEAASRDPDIIKDMLLQLDKPTAESMVPSGTADSSYIVAVLNEMRAPLYSISGFASLMLEDSVADAGTRREYLSNLIQQSENLNRLLDDLSARLSPPGETFQIEKETVSPHQLITEAVQSARRTAIQKKNVIILSLPGTLPTVEADEMRIKQVLLNLITNAVKFSPENSAITVRAEVRKDELLIQVKDRGTGIPQDERESVFEEGYRMASCDKAAGQGLGLHICRQIVEAQGGRIWVESLEGQGSTFSLALPLTTVNS